MILLCKGCKKIKQVPPWRCNMTKEVFCVKCDPKPFQDTRKEVFISGFTVTKAHVVKR